MKRELKINDRIWHASRYWVGLGDQGFVGWNTRFLPYRIVKITKSRITCESMVDGPKPITLKREVMERIGKQYHTRFHEYFYAEKPQTDPEHRRKADVLPWSVLNLPVPYTREDVRRAYKRLAHTMHPDGGGSNAQFVELKQAHDAALRSAVESVDEGEK